MISNSLSLEQKKFDIELSGGDTVYSNTNSFTCCIIGFSNKIVKRHNSMIGDDIYITGHIGDSFIGLQILKKKISIPKRLKKYFISKFYMPSINLKMVNFLQKFANTSIDISDGLASEVLHLCKQSKVGCQLYEEKIPIDQQTYNTAMDFNLNPSTCALNGGEDYELLFTVKQKDFEEISKNAKLTIIGHITKKESGYNLIGHGDTSIPITSQGWSHI